MNCLDEGLLQALNDGELAAGARREAEAHLASCHACAAAAGETAREFALFAQAFTIDESLNVPTERLRAGVVAAIAEIQPAGVTSPAASAVRERKSSGGWVRSLWSSLAASFAPRQVAVFAGLAVVAVVLAATFYALRPGAQQTGGGGRQESARGTETPTLGTGATVVPTASPTVENSNSSGAIGGPATGVEVAKGMGPKLIRPGSEKIRPKGADETGKFRPKIAGADAGGLQVAARGPKDSLLPVERQYAREIAALSVSIERQKLQTLSPTLRAEYERNVAVVDGAIASTRAAVRSNPADKDAQEFLHSAYQEKLDLLSAVAGKSQLAAAGR